jgi:D-alanyl-D-alanine endopeptidase (penicillin-binding protein 7)
MKNRNNRSQKATQWISTWALALVLALPSAASAATKPTQAGNKSAASQSADRKKPVASKALARKTPLAKKLQAKAPPKIKQASKQSRKTVLAKAKVRPNKTQPRDLPTQARNSTQTQFAAQRPATADTATPLPSKWKISSPAPFAATSQTAPVASLAPTLAPTEHLSVQETDLAMDLSSSVALVVDQDTNEVLFRKNDSAVLPIASLTKLMTGLVIADANLPMDETITITQDDVDIYKGSRSRLAVGSTLSRGELMHLALMSSENRAAHALGRTFPGGLQHFVALMNSKARELGMRDTRYVEPTGLLSQNQSSARDLATLVSVAYQRPILRDLSTSPSHQLALGHRTLQFNNSNRLIQNPEWDIGLQKTGYIAEAGRCLVMQAKVAGRKVIMVFLNSAGKLSRLQDAERMRRWVESQTIQSTFARPQG